MKMRVWGGVEVDSETLPQMKLWNREPVPIPPWWLCPLEQIVLRKGEVLSLTVTNPADAAVVIKIAFLQHPEGQPSPPPLPKAPDGRPY